MSKQKTIIIILVAIILALAIVASSAIFLLFNNKNNTPNNTTGGDDPSNPSIPDNPSNPGNPNLNDSENSVKYLQAMSLIESGKYAEAYELLTQLGNYKDAANYLSNFYYFPTKIYLTESIDQDMLRLITSYIDIVLNDERFPVETIYEYNDQDHNKWKKQYSYDSEGRLTRESDSDSANEYIYDSNGNLIKEIYSFEGEIRRTTEYTYDRLGYLIAKSFGDTTYTYKYDYRGNLIEEVRGSNSVINYTYDSQDRLLTSVRKYDLSFSHPDEDIIECTYDLKGNLVKRVEKYAYEPSYTYYFTYDDNNNLIQELREDVVNRKSYIDYTYDSKGQIIKTVQYSSDSTAVYTYEYSYDEYGNLIEYKYLDVYETQKHEYNPETGWYEPVGDPYIAEKHYTQKIDYTLVYTANIEQYEDTFELFNYIYEDTFELVDVYKIK